METLEIIKRQGIYNRIADINEVLKKVETLDNEEEVFKGLVLLEKLRLDLNLRYGANPSASKKERLKRESWEKYTDKDLQKEKEKLR